RVGEDAGRARTVELARGDRPVGVPGEDLAACMDILLENVFAHTPDGAGLAIRLSRRAAGGAWLVVADDGPGFHSPDPTERGRSNGGATRPAPPTAPPAPRNHLGAPPTRPARAR